MVLPLKAKRSERLEPVAGGRHGGRLFFRDSTGAGYAAERYGNTPGKLTIRRYDGLDDDGGVHLQETLTQEVWERRYLGGVNERVFRQLFAITLSELQAIGMLEGDELESSFIMLAGAEGYPLLQQKSCSVPSWVRCTVRAEVHSRLISLSNL